MRLTLFLITFFAAVGLYGPTAKEAAAQCTHLGGQGACPVGIPNGSTSVSFNANGTINWNSGGVSGPCCAAPSGTETGAGLLDLNNQLGGRGPGFGNNAPNGLPLDQPGGVAVSAPGAPPVTFYPGDCGPGGCTEGAGGAIFGAGPNSGYLCDAGGPGCGNDLWTSTPQPGFGDCGPGGCTGGSSIRPLDFSNVPGSGPYAQNSTTGDIDPFGGGSSFMDPATGEAISISDNPAEWPGVVKHADELNSAYVNGQIPYPFNDPDWRNKSVEDFENEPPPGLDNVSRPLEPYSIGNSNAADTENGGTSSTDPGPNFSNKAGRFGIGADTSLGDVGGLSARFQVAKNFGVQAIVSFTPVGTNDENPNADLTNYVSAFIATTQPTSFVSVLPVVTPAPAPASTPADEDTDEPPEPRVDGTMLRTRGWNSMSGIDRIDTEGQGTVYRVTTSGGRYLDFESRDDAFLFSDRFNAEAGEKSYNQIMGELPADRGPINVGTQNNNVVDALAENVPKEFQAPRVNDGAGGEFFITDPRTNTQLRVSSAEQRDIVLNAMNNGATLKEAAEIVENAPVVTPDGLASATTSSTPRSAPSTPVPAGSTVTFTDNRPAIIVAPARPEGTTVGSMKGVIQGQAYDIQIIRAENGKAYAVGTGENASHVFGEVKETSNKLIGDWRREGPWTPPPAKTQTATAPATTPGTQQTQAPQPSSPQAANNPVRSQIANTDREYMTQKFYTYTEGDYRPGNIPGWTATGR